MPRSDSPLTGAFVSRRAALSVIAAPWIASALGGCGGGGAAAGAPAVTPPVASGTRVTTSITSRKWATGYLLNVYLPPASAGPRSGLPTLFLLDGDSWFETAVAQQATQPPAIIVGVGNAGQRDRDFVPSNLCTPAGGGEADYLDFFRGELLPMIDGSFGGDPTRRILFGHSHGGSFVLYAMFAQAPGRHAFRAYLSCDASIPCLVAAADAWDQRYAASYRELPVRLHLSYATQGNRAGNQTYVQTIKQRSYVGLAMADVSFEGTHGGIVPQALSDGLRFALAAA